MVDRRRFLAGLGSLAIGSGALIQSGAFSEVAADRGVSVQTAADQNALLGLGGVSDAGTTPTFTNNASISMDIRLTSTEKGVEFDVGADDSFTDSARFSLNPGTTEQVAIEGDGGSAKVSVTAKLPSSSAPQATISLTREYALQTQAGQIQLTPNVKSVGNSGQYTFELENTGSIGVTIEAIEINSTSNPNAARVDKGGILIAGGQSVLSSSIHIKQDKRVDFDRGSDVSLGVNESVEFKFQRFVTKEGKNAKMKKNGSQVTATYYFTDGSSKTIEMSPN